MSAARREENRQVALILQNTLGTQTLYPTGVTLTNATPMHVAVVDSTGSQVGLFGAEALNQKITTSGSITYIGLANPGVAQSAASWQAHKIDSTDANNVIITWADGDGLFNNIATDLTALTYS